MSVRQYSSPARSRDEKVVCTASPDPMPSPKDALPIARSKRSAEQACLPERSAKLIPQGSLQLYTNPSRGTFTPVMAQALRLAGQGTQVLIVQFLKGGINQGPENRLLLGSSLEWVRCRLHRCIDTPQLDPDERVALDELWHFTQAAVGSGRYDLVVLDELSLAMKLGLIPEEAVLALIDQRPISMDMVITGPEMPDSLLERADLITQLRQRLRALEPTSSVSPSF
ncbi:cob(I)yrinic acid a,c-diamide adenosyltransferase [Synechococcus sp. Nb3U1]|uniref:cob(I)yrinic acid a,c-diamide adenosyltransferase n=1 Tax=Synechococcus sp. Nb3U1 TaxID=1914529 RepID=UPI001F2A3BBA|nr:cob(I)yrinic acid a,c-diamide adenosyltransferase [Synechococcus sp. Nb3U1]